jgi:hypothetical protein
MISHFWNLCRACPALDVDKVIPLLYLVADTGGKNITDEPDIWMTGACSYVMVI